MLFSGSKSKAGTNNCGRTDLYIRYLWYSRRKEDAMHDGQCIGTGSRALIQDGGIAVQTASIDGRSRRLTIEQ